MYTFIFGPALLLELVIDAKYINLMITSLIFLFIEFFFISGLLKKETLRWLHF